MSLPHQDGWDIVDSAFDVFEDYDEEVAVVGTPPQGAVGPGVSQASIDRLPSYQYTTEEAAAIKEGMFTCSICLGEVEPGQKVRVLTCEHEFHAPCVDQWLLGNRTCPMCRSVVQG